MIAKTHSASYLGLESYAIDIEIDLAPGLPKMIIVGLPDQAVRESKERVKAAIKNSGFPFPAQKIIVNLAPADRKKEGPIFDLAIALGILASTGYLRQEILNQYGFIGELALDGSIRSVKGALLITELFRDLKKPLVAPWSNRKELGLVPNASVFLAKTLVALVKQFNEGIALPELEPSDTPSSEALTTYPFDFHEVKGQRVAKRAIEIAVAGGHNLLMIGPPGSGKSMLARRIPSILPPLGKSETLAITKIHSAAGLAHEESPLVTQPPFRTPHHTISPAGLAGGGTFPRPGEVSLAHHGVLFLDELPEFRRDALEILRGPLEEGFLVIGRAKGSLRFPARFMLVAAMNPCRCGFLGDLQKSCRCSLAEIEQYRRRISGPLLDRIDLQIEVPRLRYIDLTSNAQEENSAVIRERVLAARSLEKNRFEQHGFLTNAQMNDKAIKEWVPLTQGGKDLLKAAMNDLGLSARAYSRILKVSRTIADLARSEMISEEQIAEAIQYRSLDRNLMP